MNTEHTGIPRLIRSTPIGVSVRIEVDTNPFCNGEEVTFTPILTNIESSDIEIYEWYVRGVATNYLSTFTTSSLQDGDTVNLVTTTYSGKKHYSNVITMAEKTSGCITELHYGLLYNWYAATDVRGITSSNDWVVASSTYDASLGDWETLIKYIDSEYGGELTLEGGKKLKETGLVYWLSNDGTNEYNFNNKGAGTRTNSSFGGLRSFSKFWTTRIRSETEGIIAESFNSGVVTPGAVSLKYVGWSVRLIKQATPAEQLLADGTACEPYTGNDGKNYRTVKIGTQVWLADNIAETKFRNGDWIHGFDGGVYTPISNAEWANLTDSALCAYNDDWSNV